MHIYPVALEQGHWKTGTGASGRFDEANANWNVMEFVAEGLKRHGIIYFIVHKKDENPTLAERVQRAKDWGAELYISIHHNAGKADGYEIYKSSQLPLSSQFADLLAKEFKAVGQNAHGKGVAIKTMGNGNNWYGVIREADARGIPSVISEFCYVDSKDAEIADTYTEQKEKEAAAIVKAICKLCDIKYIGI